MPPPSAPQPCLEDISDGTCTSSPLELCYKDPRCLTPLLDPYGLLGCNAGGVGMECRFCGFGIFGSSGIICPLQALPKETNTSYYFVNFGFVLEGYAEQFVPTMQQMFKRQLAAAFNSLDVTLELDDNRDILIQVAVGSIIVNASVLTQEARVAQQTRKLAAQRGFLYDVESNRTTIANFRVAEFRFLGINIGNSTVFSQAQAADQSAEDMEHVSGIAAGNEVRNRSLMVVLVVVVVILSCFIVCCTVVCCRFCREQRRYVKTVGKEHVWEEWEKHGKVAGVLTFSKIDPHSLQEEFREGPHGKLWRAKLKGSDEVLLLHYVPSAIVQRSKPALLAKHCEALHRLEHEHLVRFIGLVRPSNNVGSWGELVRYEGRHSLADLLYRAETHAETADALKAVWVHMLSSITSGVSYLHSHDLAHLSLHPGNLERNESLHFSTIDTAAH